jgi:hypothetical protein
MSKDDYRRALDAAVREYEALIAQHAELDARIAQLRHSIGALTKLCGYEPTVPFGLTDACRLVLRNSETPLTALEVRDRLRTIGVDLDKYTNPLASIHTVLKRMHDGGEVREGEREESSRTAYSFVLPGGAAMIAVGRGRRDWPRRRPTGEGLCPPKDRKK